MNVGVYLRVSTAEQTAANQLPEIRQLCAVRGWTVIRVYTDTMSGAARRRPGFQAMMADAAHRRFDAVVMWSLDRWGRGPVADGLTAIDHLDKLGVAVVSAREPWLDTSGPFREALIAFALCVARLERTRLIERTKAGLQRAKDEGVRLGRPPVSDLRLAEARQHVVQGRPVAVAARLARVGEGTLGRHLRARGLLQAGAKKGCSASAP